MSKIKFTKSKNSFINIPGFPIAYWIGNKTTATFSNSKIGELCEPRMGLTTGQNEKYLRYWFEVNRVNIGFNMNRENAKCSSRRWFPYDKGGECRKWYGNREFIVDWYNDGIEMQTTMHPDGTRIWAHNFNLDYIFREHITWTDLTSSIQSFRYFEQGFLFDSSSATAFVPDSIKYYLLGFLNSKYVDLLSNILNPTMHFKLGDFANLPIIISKENSVDEIVFDNISVSKDDWDSFETSWDFKKHPLI